MAKAIINYFEPKVNQRTMAVSITCPVCGTKRTLNFYGWEAIMCGDHEVQHPGLHLDPTKVEAADA